MGIYSTLDITRKTAIEKIRNVDLDNDEIISKLMDVLLEPRLYNVRIVNDDEKNDDYIID
jgi:hypothetical protein